MKLLNSIVHHKDTKNTKNLTGIFSLLFLLFISVSTFAAEIEVIDADNNRYQGDRIVFDKEQCILYKDITPTAVAYKNIAGITFEQNITGAVKSPLKIITPTWDTIYGTIEGGEKDKVIFNSPLLGSIRLPFSMISQIETTGFQQASQEKRDEDILYLANGDKDRGVIILLDSQKLVFKSSLYNKEIDYKTGDIGCLKFSLIDAALPSAAYKPGAQVICWDGSLISGRISEIKPDQLSIDLFRIPISAMNFAYFRFPYDRCVYLSDKSPTVVKEYAWPFAQDDIFLWPYQPDRGVSENTPIRIKGKTYHKGLGVHANSELTYTLSDGPYRTFYAVIGLDDTAGDKASVQFAVYLDDKKAYESKVFRYGDAPEEIAIPIDAGYGCLKLIVTDAGDGYIHDRAAWALARVVKP
jgi:hypothetical protein